VFAGSPLSPLPAKADARSILSDRNSVLH